MENIDKPLSSIQISKSFKEVLRRQKRKDESFEDCIKRISTTGETNPSIDCRDASIDAKDHSIDTFYRQTPHKNKEKQKDKIEIHPFPLPEKIQEKFEEAKKLERDPLNNAEIIPPTHSIKQIPF